MQPAGLRQTAESSELVAERLRNVSERKRVGSHVGTDHGSHNEDVRLNMELEAMVSLKNIEEYATEELGLTKLENSQVSYVTLDEGERVVTASGDQGLRVWERIKEGFSLLGEKLK